MRRDYHRELHFDARRVGGSVYELESADFDRVGVEQLEDFPGFFLDGEVVVAFDDGLVYGDGEERVVLEVGLEELVVGVREVYAAVDEVVVELGQLEVQLDVLGVVLHAFEQPLEVYLFLPLAEPLLRHEVHEVLADFPADQSARKHLVEELRLAHEVLGRLARPQAGKVDLCELFRLTHYAIIGGFRFQHWLPE